MNDSRKKQMKIMYKALILNSILFNPYFKTVNV